MLSNNNNIITEIRPYDVICGKDSKAFNNIGNRRFRITISLNLDRYNAAQTRDEKSAVIMDVVNVFRNNGARFLKRRTNKKQQQCNNNSNKNSNDNREEWIEVGDKRAREKVGHALRDTSVQQQTTASKFLEAKRKCMKYTPPSLFPTYNNHSLSTFILLPLESVSSSSWSAMFDMKCLAQGEQFPEDDTFSDKCKDLFEGVENLDSLDELLSSSCDTLDDDIFEPFPASSSLWLEGGKV